MKRLYSSIPGKQVLMALVLLLGTGLGASIQAQTNLCGGQDVGLVLNVFSGSVQWEVSTDGITWTPINGATSATTLQSPSVESWYRACVTDGTCDPVYSDTTHVTLSDLSADAGLDQSVCNGSSVTLGGASPASGGVGPYTYSWTPASTLNNGTIGNPDATPVANTNYILTVTDSAGCTASDTVFVDTLGTSVSGVDTFFYTGTAQTFTVPGCVTSITITAVGAGGGDISQSGGSPGGFGASLTGTFAVSPGDVLDVIVGQKGYPDQYTSGGGGGSGVVFNNQPMVIAGGGAGVDFQDVSYAGRHAVLTANGVDGNNNAGSGGVAGADGSGWVHSSVNFAYGGRGFNAGATGSTGQNGVSSNTATTDGTFGLGGGGGSVSTGYCNCGAGGGGYSGGGSANINRTGGGGGSINNGTNTSGQVQVNGQDGWIIIQY